jgi:hypothetical protein
MKRTLTRLGVLLLVVALALLPLTGCKKAESDIDAASGEPRTTIRNLRILSTFRNEGTMTQAGASSLENFLHIAVPTAVATATPGVMINSAAVSAPLEIRKASTPVFQVNGSGNIDAEGSLDMAGPGKFTVPTAVATATPGVLINVVGVSAPLEVQKAATKLFQVAGSGNVYILGTTSATGAVTVGASGTGADVTFYSGTAGDLFLWDASEECLDITGTNGQNALRVLDGNVSLADDLAVTGATTLTGALAANGGISVDGTAFSVTDTTGAVQAGALTIGVSGTGADVTFYSGPAGDLLLWDASEECLDITGTNAQNALRVLDGNVDLADGLTVTGATALNGGLSMDATAFTVADTSGNTVIGGTLLLTGTATLNGGLVMDGDAFAVANTSGNTQIGGTLGVTGTTTLAGALNADGGIAVDTSNFTVSGTTGAVATASTVAIGTFAIAGKAATVVVTEGSTITALGTYQPITSTAVVSTSLVTAIANGATAGQMLIIVNANAADAITIVNGANTVAKADIVLGTKDVAAFMWDGADWVCLFVRDNSA